MHSNVVKMLIENFQYLSKEGEESISQVLAWIWTPHLLICSLMLYHLSNHDHSCLNSSKSWSSRIKWWTIATFIATGFILWPLFLSISVRVEKLLFPPLGWKKAFQDKRALICRKLFFWPGLAGNAWNNDLTKQAILPNKLSIVNNVHFIWNFFGCFRKLSKRKR